MSNNKDKHSEEQKDTIKEAATAPREITNINKDSVCEK